LQTRTIDSFLYPSHRSVLYHHVPSSPPLSSLSTVPPCAIITTPLIAQYCTTMCHHHHPSHRSVLCHHVPSSPPLSSLSTVPPCAIITTTTTTSAPYVTHPLAYSHFLLAPSVAVMLLIKPTTVTPARARPPATRPSLIYTTVCVHPLAGTITFTRSLGVRGLRTWISVRGQRERGTTKISKPPSATQNDTTSDAACARSHTP
jgi:hypothetical protein